jgi:hypothetical protein
MIETAFDKLCHPSVFRPFDEHVRERINRARVRLSEAFDIADGPFAEPARRGIVDADEEFQKAWIALNQATLLATKAYMLLREPEIRHGEPVNNVCQEAESGEEWNNA